MTAKHRYENIQISVKKKWKLPTGHKENKSYNSCTIDTRPKRMRTRQAKNNFVMKEYE